MRPMKIWRMKRSSTTISMRMRTKKKKRMRRNNVVRLVPARMIDSGLIESALALLLILSCASTLAAQKSKKEDSTTRTLQGTVLDADGSPVQQAVVQLKD